MSKHRNEIKFEKKEEFYTTSRGDKLILRAVPPLLIPTITASVEIPLPPTYSVETATGDVETHPHEIDEEKGVDTRKTPEDFANWEAYVNARNTATNSLTEKIMNAILLEGVVLPANTINKKNFEKKLSIMGLDLPEDEEDLVHMYKQLYVASSEEDMANILNIVMELSGISGGEVEITKKSFPDKVESGA